MRAKRKGYKSVEDAYAAERAPIVTNEDLRAELGDNPGLASDFELGIVPRRPGRPKAGESAEGTMTKTVRQTRAFWELFEETAKRAGLTPHDAMRRALAVWMAQHPSREGVKKARGRSKTKRSAARVARPTLRWRRA